MGSGRRRARRKSGYERPRDFCDFFRLFKVVFADEEDGEESPSGERSLAALLQGMESQGMGDSPMAERIRGLLGGQGGFFGKTTVLHLHQDDVAFRQLVAQFFLHRPDHLVGSTSTKRTTTTSPPWRTALRNLSGDWWMKMISPRRRPGRPPGPG